jgi:SAM-dependent methyltransferase
MSSRSRRYSLIGAVLVLLSGCAPAVRTARPTSGGGHTERDALNMIRASRGRLAPVYGPLAEQIVADFDLQEKTGIGIDIGSGPGTLIIELCKRTPMHWINADINPHFFPHFYNQAAKHGCADRASAIPADVHSLPFRDNYADIIVSRGSFPFWREKTRAFAEIYRVLKPGAAAHIGRGFSENLPVDTAKRIRAGQGAKMRYDLDKTTAELREIMKTLAIKDYEIHRPRSDLREVVNYGIWITFRKDNGGQ